MGRFPYEKLVERSPHLSPAGLKEEKAIIDYNVRRHGTKPLQRMLTGVLYRELKDYRIYSMSKRFDNLSLWAKYAGDHSGYCLEFANEGPLFANARDVLYEDSLAVAVKLCPSPSWCDSECRGLKIRTIHADIGNCDHRGRCANC
jgi:hypothetical protein